MNKSKNEKKNKQSDKNNQYIKPPRNQHFKNNPVTGIKKIFSSKEV